MGVAALLVLAVAGCSVLVEGGTWCVGKGGVGDQSLQKSLDYACGAGADCLPVQVKGACYQPNTVLAHASYAMNSFFQMKGQSPAACDFSGTATLTTTDPSYGSCVYPSSASGAGGTSTVGTSTAGSSTNGTSLPGFGPSSNNIDYSLASCHTLSAALVFVSLSIWAFFLT